MKQKRQTEYAREYRHRHKAKGLCINCSRPARAAGLNLCREHAEQAARKAKERRTRLLLAGVCPMCGQNPVRPNRQMCKRCGELGVVKNRKRFRKRKRLGLCGYGGCPNSAEPKQTLCRTHLEALKSHNYKMYANRLAAGLCRQCGLRPRLFGDSAHCLFCRIKNRGKFTLPIKMRKVIRQFWRLDRIDIRRKQAENALEHIPDERVYKIISLRQGLTDGVDHTLEEVGEVFKVTRERIRQIETKAYRYLKSIDVSTDLMRKPSDLQRSPSAHKPKRKVNKHKTRKLRAQRIAAQAVQDGKLNRRPCERCGALKTYAHHHDYSKPLDVVWLCPSHHAEAHGRKVRTNKKQRHYVIPCWLANANPSNEHYDAPAIVEILSRLWIKQQQIMDVTRLKRGTIIAIINGQPVDDKSLAIMLRYIEALKQERAA